MIALWMLLGGLVGAVNGVTRWLAVARLSAGRRGHAVLLTVGGMAIRLGLVTGLLVAAFRQDVVAGLLAFLGLLVVRSAIVIWAHAHDWSWPSTFADREGFDRAGSADRGAS